MTLERKSPSGPSAGGAPVWDPTAVTAGDQAAPETPAAASAALTKPRVAPRRANATTNALLAIGAIVAMGGLGFAAGRFTTPAASDTGNGNGGAPVANASGAPGGPGDGGGRGGFGGSVMVSGTVVSVGTDSFTVKLASGQTVTIATGSSTTYHSQTSGSSTDLTAGKTVQVQTTGGSGGGPNANSSGAPAASGSAGTGTRTATDVTITGS